jgi:hypothetical protein
LIIPLIEERINTKENKRISPKSIDASWQNSKQIYSLRIPALPCVRCEALHRFSDDKIPH